MAKSIFKCFTAFFALFVAFVLTAAGSVYGDSLIDDFENSNSPAPWTFSSDGAGGSLTSGTGYTGHGGHLAYNFSSGGSYVAANLVLSSPVTTPAISFWVKSPSNIRVELSVVDSSGQTLIYLLSRPLEVMMDTNAWYQHVVSLDGAYSWSGGLNDGVVHYPVNQIGIRAALPPEPAFAVNAIDFDNVWAVSSTGFDLDPAAALIPGPDGSSNLLSGMGVNVHFTSDNIALDAARSAGFSWVRTDLAWASVETSPNVYNWSSYDGLVSALQNRGMHALLILDYGNPLYTGSSSNPPTNAPAITAFCNFARAAASHFAGTGTRFEVWNEPDGGFWPPAANAMQYATLAAQAIQSVHLGDSNALVATGGTSLFSLGFMRTNLANGGGVGANGIGLHPYGINQPPRGLTDYLLQIRTMVSQYLNPAPPLWDTEWGFSSADFGPGNTPAARNRQGTKVADQLLTSCAAGFPIYVYYDIRDDGDNPINSEYNFGLLANDYSEKPAMTAVKTIASVARGRNFAGFIHAEPSTLNVMRFDSPADQVFALWSDSPNTNSQVIVTVPTNALVRNFLGVPPSLTVTNNRIALAVDETNGPFYFIFPDTPPMAPTGVAAVVGNAQVSLNWNGDIAAASYNVKQATASGGPYATIATGVMANSYTNTVLAGGTTYFYVIDAVNVYGAGNDSVPVGATTVPAAPAGISATGGNGQVILNWVTSTGTTNYYVKMATVSGGPYNTIASVAGTGYTNTSLVNGTTYYYVVSAVGFAGESSNSIQASATPQSVSLIKDNADASGIAINGAWTVATATSGYYGANYLHDGNTGSIGGKSVQFTPVINLAGRYDVYVRWASFSNRATNAPVDVNFLGSTQTFLVNQQINGGTWNWLGTFPFGAGSSGNVKVRNDGANGYVIADAVEFIQATITPPSTPTGLTATVSSNTANLAWAPASGATSYNVKRSTVSGGPYAIIATGVTTTNAVDAGVNPGAFYYVISAINGGGESPNSPEASLVINPPVLNYSLTANSLKFNWTGDFQLQFQTNSNSGIGTNWIIFADTNNPVVVPINTSIKSGFFRLAPAH